MKRIFLLFFSMLVAVIVHAQIPLGFKAGVNTNTIVVRNAVDEYDDDSEIGVAFHLGVFTKLKLPGKFNLIPELQFIQKQSKYSSGNFRLSYIELPFLISYQTFQRLSIEPGPSIGLNIASNLYVDSFKKADGGIVGGPTSPDVVKFHSQALQFQLPII
jgi:hypothetical protein